MEENEEKQKILLVDDKPENLIALEAVLEDDSRELIKAFSGNDALKVLLKERVSLVLLDVQMPEMDGFEVAQLMHNNPKIAKVPIIFVTAISKEKKYVVKGYEVGAVDYLFKPIEPVILKSKVKFFLELDQQKRAMEKLLARSRQSEQTFNQVMEDPSTAENNPEGDG